VGNDLLVPDSKRERGGMLAMLFWVLAALAVVGALAIVWGLVPIGPPLALAARCGPGLACSTPPRPVNGGRGAG
jgi:hypothetical protein